MRQPRILEKADWGEAEKEAPRDYVISILERVYFDSVIVDLKGMNIAGADWELIWPKTGKKFIVDDKNDRHLGYTGNINLDEKTLEKKEVIQLFVNYPDFEETYLFLDNEKLNKYDIEKNCIEKLARMQPWGEYTYSYVIPVAKIGHAVPKHPNFAQPSVEWFMQKRPRRP